jgi:hypothetical protein
LSHAQGEAAGRVAARTLQFRSEALLAESVALRASASRLVVRVSPGAGGAPSPPPTLPRSAGFQTQNAALEAEVQRLRRQEAVNFAALTRLTEEKLAYMRKLAEAEGEAFMNTVLLRKVPRCRPLRVGTPLPPPHAP